jgi:hypothetical protein
MCAYTAHLKLFLNTEEIRKKNIGKEENRAEEVVTQASKEGEI